VGKVATEQITPGHTTNFAGHFHFKSGHSVANCQQNGRFLRYFSAFYDFTYGKTKTPSKVDVLVLKIVANRLH